MKKRRIVLNRQTEEPQIPDEVRWYIDKEIKKHTYSVSDAAGLLIPVLSVTLELCREHGELYASLNVLSNEMINNESQIASEDFGTQELNRIIKSFSWTTTLFSKDSPTFVAMVLAAKKVYIDLPEGEDKARLAELLIEAERSSNHHYTSNLTDDQIIDNIIAEGQVQ